MTLEHALTIECAFTCKRCRRKRHAFDVRAREPGEPIVAWFQFVVRPAMTAAHRRASPSCKGTAGDLWVPITGDRIGEAVKH